MVHLPIVFATSKPKETEFFRCSATKDISNFKVHAATNFSLTLVTSYRNNLNQKSHFVVSKSELRDFDKFFCFLKQPFLLLKASSVKLNLMFLQSESFLVGQEG